METIGLHVGAGIDAMVEEPTPIHDELEDRKSLSDLKSFLLAEDENSAPPKKTSRPRRILAWLGMVDD